VDAMRLHPKDFETARTTKQKEPYRNRVLLEKAPYNLFLMVFDYTKKTSKELVNVKKKSPVEIGLFGERAL
jgi:hypothetical protein